jgi:Kef-type K+ transport system membrane component KefB
MGLALAASILSVWTSVSVALIEVFVGVLAGNVIGLAAAPWVDYLAGLGAIMLAFLAGMEIRWTVARKHARASFAIGSRAFIAPFLGVLIFAILLLDWTWPQAVIGAIALSTTSVALVYAVIIEAGLNRTEAGQIVLAARFVNDIATVLALGIVAADFDYRLAVFAAAMSAALWIIPKVAPWFLEKMERRVSEPDIRFVAVVLFLLGGLGSISGTEAVVPAYVIGVALAPTLERHAELTSRLRTVAFAWFTPFYFLRAGSFVDLAELPAIAATAAALLVIKIVSKCGAIIPLTREFHIGRRDGWLIALLMSTGLTFGTIAAFFGLTHGIIDRQQYAILVTAVIASGTIPILIAQRTLNQEFPAASQPEGGSNAE